MLFTIPSFQFLGVPTGAQRPGFLHHALPPSTSWHCILISRPGEPDEVALQSREAEVLAVPPVSAESLRSLASTSEQTSAAYPQNSQKTEPPRLQHTQYDLTRLTSYMSKGLEDGSLCRDNLPEGRGRPLCQGEHERQEAGPADAAHGAEGLRPNPGFGDPLGVCRSGPGQRHGPPDRSEEASRRLCEETPSAWRRPSSWTGPSEA